MIGDLDSTRISTRPDQSDKYFDDVEQTIHQLIQQLYRSQEIIQDHYNNKKTYNIEQHIVYIEEWLACKQKTNYPLVISGKQGTGKKHLITEWINYHHSKQIKEERTYKDKIIPHYQTGGGNDKSYSYTMYNILIKLKKHLDIRQKIELEAEKLRRYFTFWLDVCSRQLLKNIVDDSQIIIVVEGADRFIDFQTFEIIPIEFWLPLVLPDRIRLIISIDSEGPTSALNYYKTNNVQILNLIPPVAAIERQIDRLLTNPTSSPPELAQEIKSFVEENKTELLKNFHKSNALISLALPFQKDGELLAELFKDFSLGQYMLLSETDASNNLSTVSIFSMYIKYLTDRLLPEATLMKLLFVLVSTSQGLTLKEIMDICDIRIQKWNTFRAIFCEYIVEYNGVYVIYNKQLKMALLDINSNKKIIHLPQLHLDVAHALVKQTPTLRNLEERCFHLYRAKNSQAMFNLKETLANIENFLIFFNPVNKFNLSLYWSILCKKGFEPVKEYNSSIEWFQMRYLPNTQTNFKIFFQVAVFLKEFSDFETDEIPDFRHPQILGQAEIEEIGLFKEINDMEMYFGDLLNGVNDEVITKYSEPKILTSWENQNVEIPQKRKKFRKHFVKIIAQQSKGLNTEKGLYSEKTQDWSSVEQKRMQSRKSNRVKTNQKKDFFSPSDTQMEWDRKKKSAELKFLENLRDPEENLNIKVGQEKSISYYYYKRWIWMQFPWACESHKNNYSQLISSCYKSTTEFMPFDQEWEQCKSTLRNAIKTKAKKQSVLQKEKEAEQEQQLGIQIQNSKTQQLPPLKNRSSSTMKGRKKQGRKTYPLTNRSSSTMRRRKKPNQMMVTQSLMSFKAIATLNSDIAPVVLRRLPPLNNHERIDLTTTIKNRKRYNSLKRGFKKRKVKKSPSSKKISEQAMIKVMGKMGEGLSKQMNYINDKTTSLVLEYNQMRFMNKNLAKHLRRITYKNKVENQTAEILSEKSKTQGVLDNISQVHNKGLMKTNEIKKQNKRYMILIAICKNNSEQNEKWLRNYKKMIKWEQRDIKKYKGDLIKIQKLKKQYYGFYKTKQKTHENLIKTIASTYAEQMKLDYKTNQFEKQQDQAKVEQNESLDANRPTGGPTMWKSGKILKVIGKKLKEKIKQKNKQWKIYMKIKDVFQELKENDSKGDSCVKQDFCIGIDKQKELQYTSKEKQDIVQQMKQKLSVLKQQLSLLKVSGAAQVQDDDEAQPEVQNVRNLQRLLIDQNRVNEARKNKYESRCKIVSRYLIMANQARQNLKMDYEYWGNKIPIIERNDDKIVLALLTKVKKIKEKLQDKCYEEWCNSTDYKFSNMKLRDAGYERSPDAKVKFSDETTPVKNKSLEEPREVDKQSEQKEKPTPTKKIVLDHNKLRKVTSSDVVESGLQLLYSLKKKKYPFEKLRSSLFSQEMKDAGCSSIMQMKEVLSNDPFYLNENQCNQLSRYIIEDNDEEYIVYTDSCSNNNQIIWSIFQKFIGHYKLQTEEEEEQYFHAMCWMVNRYKDSIKLQAKSIDKNNKSTKDKGKFLTYLQFEDLCLSLELGIEGEQKDYLLGALLLDSGDLMKLRMSYIYETYNKSAEQVEQFYKDVKAREKARIEAAKLAEQQAELKETENVAEEVNEEVAEENTKGENLEENSKPVEQVQVS